MAHRLTRRQTIAGLALAGAVAALPTLPLEAAPVAEPLVAPLAPPLAPLAPPPPALSSGEEIARQFGHSCLDLARQALAAPNPLEDALASRAIVFGILRPDIRPHLVAGMLSVYDRVMQRAGLHTPAWRVSRRRGVAVLRLGAPVFGTSYRMRLGVAASRLPGLLAGQDVYYGGEEPALDDDPAALALGVTPRGWLAGQRAQLERAGALVVGAVLVGTANGYVPATAGPTGVAAWLDRPAAL